MWAALLRIDRRVFDDGLFGCGGLERDLLSDAREQERAPVEEHVQIPVWRRGYPRDARNVAQRRHQLLGDGLGALRSVRAS